ncbi:hypothetical protein ACFPRL_03810 [Pseudoclavibacter helvolus]
MCPQNAASTGRWNLGCTGDRSFGRIALSAACCRRTIEHLRMRVLRRPIESALKRAGRSCNRVRTQRRFGSTTTLRAACSLTCLSRTCCSSPTKAHSRSSTTGSRSANASALRPG